MRLADYRGKVVVVNFWASWCDPCEDEAPLLATMAAEQGKDGVVFVGIDANDVVDDARSFAKRFGLDYAQAHDGEGIEKDRFGVTGFPETFVIDREGRAVRVVPGPDRRRRAPRRDRQGGPGVRRLLAMAVLLLLVAVPAAVGRHAAVLAGRDRDAR